MSPDLSAEHERLLADVATRLDEDPHVERVLTELVARVPGSAEERALRERVAAQIYAALGYRTGKRQREHLVLALAMLAAGSAD